MPNRLNKFLAATMVTLALGIPIYWIGSFSGLYRGLVLWQLGQWHEYYPDYTGIVTFVISILFFVVVAAAIVALQSKRTDHPQTLVTQLQSWSKKMEPLLNWLRARLIRIFFVIIGIVFFGMGVIDVLHGFRIGAIREYHFQAPFDRFDFSGGWLRVNGLIPDGFGLAFESQKEIDKAELYYPVTPYEWTKEQPVQVFLHKNQYSRLDGKLPDHFDGLVSLRGLPGIVGHEFENKGLKISPDAILIEWGQTPQDLKIGGAVYAAMGAFMAFVAGVIWLFIGWKEKKKMKSRKE